LKPEVPLSSFLAGFPNKAHLLERRLPKGFQSAFGASFFSLVLNAKHWAGFEEEPDSGLHSTNSSQSKNMVPTVVEPVARFQSKNRYFKHFNWVAGKKIFLGHE
jgi:hypothetical protein